MPTPQTRTLRLVVGGGLFRLAWPGVSSASWHRLAAARERVPAPAPAVHQTPCVPHLQSQP